MALLAFGVIVASAGWYLTAHPRGYQHFDSCRVSGDGVLFLDFSYGAGDKVTASIESRTAVVVSLRIDRPSGVQPAIALSGQVQFDSFGGLGGRAVTDRDGTIIPCSAEAAG